MVVLTMDDRAPTYSRTKKTPIQEIRASLNTAVSTPFWLDQPQRPPVTPALLEDTTADLLVVGGGYCGLWTALIAKERNPQLDVVLIEGNEIGWAASGRNGGFCESSLTHGEENGRRHFTEDLPTLSRLAAQNFQDFQDTLVRYDIDAEYENTGLLTVATEEYQVAALKRASQEGGSSTRTFYDSRSIQTMMTSPVFRAGMFESDGIALVHPAKLVWGLKRACQQLGVRIFESTPAVKLRGESQCVTVETSTALIRSRKVALATNGFPSLLKRARFLTIPVYDYVLATRPLTRAQLDDIGWASRFGITDSSRQFHYYRLTSDNRIIWGGYDAIYHRGGKVRPAYDQRPATFETLADHFFITFPQLRGISFTHAWGGMIDMSTQFVAFHGLALGGRVAYSAGYTGLGVGATRFGAQVMLDLLSGHSTELTQLKMVRCKPVPIPPEPFAYPAIQLTRRAIDKSDANGGRDGLLLRSMELFGVGFDS